MILRLFLFLILLTACGRSLTETEKAFSLSIFGDQLDTNQVRIVKGALVGSVTFQRQARPRLACRERILPPSKEEIVTVSPAAVALFSKVLFTKDWYTPNYQPQYPSQLYLVAAMLFAHEMTHVWQWQNREKTGYHPLHAAAEHGQTDDPYLFDLAGAPDFLSFGYEQQGAVVEEYVCCRALEPEAPRTKRLHSMLSDVFPVSDLPGAWQGIDVHVPWKEAKLKGICRA